MQGYLITFKYLWLMISSWPHFMYLLPFQQFNHYFGLMIPYIVIHADNAGQSNLGYPNINCGRENIHSYTYIQTYRRNLWSLCSPPQHSSYARQKMVVSCRAVYYFLAVVLHWRRNILIQYYTQSILVHFPSLKKLK